MIRFLEIFVALLSIGLQGFVVYYGYRLYKLMKPVKYWTFGWELFCISMLLIVLRRCFTTYNDIFINCPVSDVNYFFEYGLLIAISILLIAFVYKLKSLFLEYINGKGHLLIDREDAVIAREKAVTVREQRLIVEEPNGIEVNEPKKVIVDVGEKKVFAESPKKVVIINPKNIVEIKE